MPHVIVNGVRVFSYFTYFFLFSILFFLSSFVFSQLSTKLTLTSKYIAPRSTMTVYMLRPPTSAQNFEKNQEVSPNLLLTKSYANILF